MAQATALFPISPIARPSNRKHKGPRKGDTHLSNSFISSALKKGLNGKLVGMCQDWCKFAGS